MKRRTWLGLVAIGAAAVVTGAAALGAWAHGGGPHGMHGRMMKRMVSAALDEALDQAKVTPEQRASIHASRARAFRSGSTRRYRCPYPFVRQNCSTAETSAVPMP